MQLRDHALRYASLGWPVLPYQPGGKIPISPHGFDDATTDPTTIHTWWSRWPTANLGWPTGLASVDVLDIDVRPSGSGFAALNSLKRAGLIPPPLTAVQTPSAGLHLYFPGTTQRSGSLPTHHLDFKAARGCIVAPPSTIGDHAYQWVPLNNTAPSAPLDWAAIRRHLAPPATRKPPFLRPRSAPISPEARIDPLVRTVARTPQGNRNAILFWAAGRAIAEGNQEALPTLLTAALSTGLSEGEARRTIANAQRRALRPAPTSPASPASPPR